MTGPMSLGQCSAIETVGQEIIRWVVVGFSNADVFYFVFDNISVVINSQKTCFDICIDINNAWINPSQNRFDLNILA